MLTQPKSKLRGIALALALVLMPICMILMYLFVDNVLLATRASMQERGHSQTFHMAESGLVIGYDAFRSNNFAGTTHVYSGGAFSPSTSFVPPQVMPGGMTFAPDTNKSSPTYGWQKWTWSSAVPGQQFIDGDESESIAFRIYFTDYPKNSQWRIDSTATAGGWNKTESLQGYVENNANYALYSAGDLDDLSRADNLNVNGSVHANGDVYLYPKFLTSVTPPMTVNGYALGIKFDSWAPVTWPVITSLAGTDPDSAWTAFQSDAVSVTTNITGKVEAGRKIVRWNDKHNEAVLSVPSNAQPYKQISTKSCQVLIDNVALTWGVQGSAMDSDNPNWATFVSKSTALNGNVTDGSLGGQTRDCFDPRTVAPYNGYYYIRAGDPSVGSILGEAEYSTPPLGVTKTTFFNNAENRQVTVFDVDLSKYATKTNNLIYSLYPIRLSHGEILNGNVTVVSPATIYTKGNFNIGTNNMAAALITLDRIYHLSDAWNDADPRNQSAYPIQTVIDNNGHEFNAKNFPPHAGMQDTPGNLTIVADLVDGVPTINELNWIPGGSLTNPNSYSTSYIHSHPGSYAQPWQSDINCAACSDGLLEEFCPLNVALNTPLPPNSGVSELTVSSGFFTNPDKWPNPTLDGSLVGPFVKLTRIGSIMHLHCANMDPNPTCNPAPWDATHNFVTPWLVRSYYCPWIREFDSPPATSGSPPVVTSLPLFAPNISTKTLWSVADL